MLSLNILLISYLIWWFWFKPKPSIEVNRKWLKEYWVKNGGDNPYIWKATNAFHFKKLLDNLLSESDFLTEKVADMHNFEVYKISSGIYISELWIKIEYGEWIGFEKSEMVGSSLFLVTNKESYEMFRNLVIGNLKESRLKYLTPNADKNIFIIKDIRRIFHDGMKWRIDHFNLKRGNPQFDEVIYSNLIFDKQQIEIGNIRNRNVLIEANPGMGRTRILKSILQNSKGYWLDTAYVSEFFTNPECLEFMLLVNKPVTVFIDNYIPKLEHLNMLESYLEHGIKFVIVNNGDFPKKFPKHKFDVLHLRPYTEEEAENIQRTIYPFLKGYNYFTLKGKIILSDIFSSFHKREKKIVQKNQKIFNFRN